MNVFGSCCVVGCSNKANYKTSRLCQKHYSRMRRGGSTELRRAPPKYRKTNQDGYQVIHSPDHPLASASGYVYEHRMVLYSEFGEAIPPCSICGKEITWRSCHVDHIDNDTGNNARDNLRQTCSTCNTRRGRKKAHEYSGSISVTINGVTMTATEWGRQPGVSVCSTTIVRRKRAGYSDYDAVYGAKKTHNGNGADTVRMGSYCRSSAC